MTSVELDRDSFFRDMLRHLSGTLEDTVGVQEAEGYLSVVGAAVGEDIERRYRNARGGERPSKAELPAILADLKARIGGAFEVEEVSEERIVFRNSTCPFGDRSIGRPSLCMMTSNVFGYLSASAAGYARVELPETIAKGDAGCRVIVHFVTGGDNGREYVVDHEG